MTGLKKEDSKTSLAEKETKPNKKYSEKSSGTFRGFQAANRSVRLKSDRSTSNSK